MILAYTNLTDQGLTVSFEGYATDTSDEIVQDLLESDMEIAPGNTVIRDYYFDDKVPSGEISWKSFTTAPSENEYRPYETSCTLEKDNSGHYYIQGEVLSDEQFAVRAVCYKKLFVF